MSESPRRPSEIEALNALGKEFARLEAATQPRPSLSRSRTIRVLVLSAVGAAAVVLIGVLRSSESTTEQADSFNDFAALAAEQPAGIDYVKWSFNLDFVRRDSGDSSSEAATVEVEQWGDENQDYTSSVLTTATSVIENRSLVDRPSGLFCSSSLRTTERRETTEGPQCGRLSLTLDVTGIAEDLPTDPEALPEILTDEDGRLYNEYAEQLEKEAICASAKLAYASVPIDVNTDRSTLITGLDAAPGKTVLRSGVVNYDIPEVESIFSYATMLLSEPTASPALRSALFTVLAELDGADIGTGGEDQLGRSASIIEYRVPAPEEGDRRALDQVFVDPETSQVLELRTTVSKGGGEVLGTYERVFSERSVVDSLPEQAQPLEDLLAAAEAEC